MAGCESCIHRVPIGEGDHLCEATDYPDDLVLVAYMPGPDYLACTGIEYEEG